MRRIGRLAAAAAIAAACLAVVSHIWRMGAWTPGFELHLTDGAIVFGVSRDNASCVYNGFITRSEAWIHRSPRFELTLLPSAEFGRGFAVRVPLWGLAGVLGFASWTIRYLCPRHRDPARCGECGYDLTGNVSGRCPECGIATEQRG